MTSSASSPSRRRARLARALERDGDRCVWCGRAFSRLVTPTRDHVVPRARGGPSWLENEVPACRRCNGERGHRGAVEWLEECARRGWQPDAGAVLGAMTALEEAIAERGGQRRARAHLAAQLRRAAR